MSGGERQRLSLAILVHSGANVLILDEPTNHLDLESREALEDALQQFQGALLLISHDRALLDAVGTRTVAVEDQTLHSYVGGWPEYLRVREERADAERTAKRSKPAPEPPKPKPAARSKNEVARAKKLEAEIEAAEAALAALEVELADPTRLERPALGGEVDRPPRRGQARARGSLFALGGRRRLTFRDENLLLDRIRVPGPGRGEDRYRARRSDRSRGGYRPQRRKRRGGRRSGPLGRLGRRRHRG